MLKHTRALEKAAIFNAIARLRHKSIDSLKVFQSIDSTNSYLLQQTVSVGSARVCVAEVQAAGRGRRGNRWQSSSGSNIMMSLSWGFSHWPETVTGLGLAVALVVAERINHDHGLAVKIKWPNDLMINGNKLGGILIDVGGEADGVCNVVIGLGLNVRQLDWSTETGYAWVDLHSLGIDIDRNTFIGQLTSDWIDMLTGFEKNGFAPLVAVWNQHSSYAGRKISVGDEQQKIQGRMLGVNDKGALIVEADNGEIHSFADSNVSVRLVDE